MTGFPGPVRRLIRERADGYCERCATTRGDEIHHRRPRGMGGTLRESSDGAANGVLLCTGCHRWVESNRTEALLEGFLVLQHASPRNSAIKYKGIHYVYLDDRGNLTMDAEDVA